jgi:DNA-binding transcriptional MerR regulator
MNHTEGPAVDERITITEVAKALGVTTKTITRWEKAGKVKKAKRDWRGWRIYTTADVQELKSLVEAVY